MENSYPPGPASIPENLTAPGPAYKRQSKVALLSLLVFIALYLSLTGWFAWTAWNYFTHAQQAESGPLIAYGLAAAAAFLSVFLIKALFFVDHGGEINDMEVTAEEQPELFRFLHRLADEAGAPKPHRVFLSGRVNAAVFYDLTLLNLIFPSKKNLEIGLALVNSLNLGELKAVLAHEFGHFQQGSMAVGRWVYVAQQVATHIVYQRDALDKFLAGLSSIDFRIAWIGWILRLIVWALRAILDSAFSLVVLAQRSLSREMEFHADMVSVSLTGSDALVHALHKLGAADDAWSRALNFAGQELGAGRAVPDIFVIQKIITQRMKTIVDDEYYEAPPPLPDEGREQHRVFDAEDAQPPRMWSTHPPNCDREENAKKLYVAADIDERPAWDIFANAGELRERMTEHLLRQAPDAPEIPKSSVADSVSLVTQQYTKMIFEQRYRGCYMGRSVVREFESAHEAIGNPDPSLTREQQFDALYPHDLAHKFEHWRHLEGEKETLRALRDGLLEPPDGVLRHRGKIIKRKELPDAIEELREECNVARREVAEHDRLVRGTHNLAAADLGSNWQAYHTGLVQLLHFADHTAANLNDVHGRLGNMWAVITADGKITDKEVKQLLVVCEDLYGVLRSVNATTEHVRLSSDLAQELGVESWQAALSEEFGLPPATRENLSDWLGAAESWVNYFLGSLRNLQAEALETLLEAEERIEKMARRQMEPVDPPTAGGITVDYPTLLPNTERKLQRTLGFWDRFQTATGFVPGLLRFAVATTIVGGLLGAGIWSSGHANVTIFNGLLTPVVVTLPDGTVNVPPMQSRDVTTLSESDLEIETRTQDGMLVEAIDVDSSNSFVHYVYNVAGAMALVRWDATYGNVRETDPVYLGAMPWLTTDVDYLFRDPPESINSSGDGGRRSVLSQFEDFDPRYLDDYFPANADTSATIRTHATWDRANAPYTWIWMALADNEGYIDDVVAARLQRDPDEVMSLRYEQDRPESGPEHDKVCERHTAVAESRPDSADWQYLATRCVSRAQPSTAPFGPLAEQYPDNYWIQAAAAYEYGELGRWDDALTAFEYAHEKNRGLRLSYATDVARARRMVHGVGADFSDVTDNSPWLEFQYSLVEGAEQNNPIAEAYMSLQRGDLEAALGATEGSDYYDEMLRMAAASDGASDQLVVEALALDPSRGLSAQSIWIAIGFAIRNGEPIDELLAAAEEYLGDDAARAAAFFNALQNPERAEAEMFGLVNPARLGSAYAGGLVALGDRAPDEWRDNAKRLLFITERPYFR